jgi:CRP-like cAMP-binding protein
MPKTPVEKVPLLENDLFVGFSKADLKKIEAAGELRRYKPGKTIFVEGDDGTHIFCIVSGRVEISIGLGRMDEAPVHVGTPGSVFGEFILFDGNRRTATARAVKPVKLLAIKNTELQKVLEENPAMGYRLMRNLCTILVGRICKTTDDLRASLTW